MRNFKLCSDYHVQLANFIEHWTKVKVVPKRASILSIVLYYAAEFALETNRLKPEMDNQCLSTKKSFQMNLLVPLLFSSQLLGQSPVLAETGNFDPDTHHERSLQQNMKRK
jgi:hypothetical protein